MATALSTRIRAFWLACLLALAPAGPLGLLLTSHGPEAEHGVALTHDAADHGIAPGSLPDRAPDRHCLYCQTASSLRLGWLSSASVLDAPASAPADAFLWQAVGLRFGLRHALPARAPPAAA